MKTATSETLIERTVKPISAAPLQRGLHRAHALLEVAGDVLEHDDGVVDHEAGGDRQGHQREIVDAVAEQVHDPEGADQGDRHGDAGNQGGPRARAGRRRPPGSPARSRCIRVLSTSWTEARMVMVWSRATVSLIAPADRGLQLRQSRLIASTVSMMLAPGWRKMMSRAAGLPLARPSERDGLDGVDDLGHVAEPAPAAPLR